MAFKHFLFFAAFRILNVFLIQSQFDPDEFWQNLEPSYCRVFGEDLAFDNNSRCPGLTWEWKRRRQERYYDELPGSWSDRLADAFTFGLEGPVRSFSSILPTLVFYAVIKRYKWDSSWMVSRGPLIVNAIFVAAVTDWCVWYSSRWMKSMTTGNEHNSKARREDRKNRNIVFWCIYCSLTSWFNGYTLVRTYSNSLETSLLAVSFALISPVFLSAVETASDSKASMARAWVAFFIGGICVSIRFTCLTAYIPMGIILARQTSKTISAMVAYLFRVCALAGLLGFASTVVLDRVMYGVWAIPVLGNFHFNVIQGNGSLYGTHPFHWYFTAGIPALTGILFPVLVYDLWFGRQTRATRNLWTIIACYVVAHSASAHKEFRFLLPVLPIICLVCGARLQTLAIGLAPSQTNRLLVSIAGLNLIAVLYLGLVHQRAPIDVNQAILKSIDDFRALQGGSAAGIEDVAVHYLMGCHSTPLLSHMHDPPTRFDPWYLDCGPKCRADSATECESDVFSKDPDGFLLRTYFERGRDRYCETENEDDVCTATTNFKPRPLPQYVVCSSENLGAMKKRLQTMGMLEIGRFMNGINGIQIGRHLTFGSDSFFDPDSTRVGFLNDLFVLGLEEIILFKNPI
ncbi:unnamed protein product [Pseudo-nitzschia multistriata]|uniref:Mannosyltransferase n=1 Tax=Pseudo-nitzschia multistriata TaxID=183589 RepID=A0A448Z8W2_9STRA|nr:unnamed protein product [Pseudo-nitzschia multistriata]